MVASPVKNEAKEEVLAVAVVLKEGLEAAWRQRHDEHKMRGSDGNGKDEAS